MRPSILAFLLALPADLLLAQEAAPAAVPGAEIAALVGDHTVQGSMTTSGPYAEFYAADGTIRGDGYTGAWSVEGDRMCFAYGEEPPTCYGVGIDGDAVAWLGEGGAVEGTGTLVEGNANGF